MILTSYLETLVTGSQKIQNPTPEVAQNVFIEVFIETLLAIISSFLAAYLEVSLAVEVGEKITVAREAASLSQLELTR